MARYKLTYFNLRGRAELTRLTLSAAGQDFEDNRISYEDFLKIKNDLPQNQLPILEFDGQTLPQSLTIVRYLAREYGLYGNNNLESATVDIVLDTLVDTYSALVKVFSEKDETIKKQLAKTLSDTGMPQLISIFGKILRQNNGGDGWIVGTKMTVADLALYTLFDDLTGGVYGSDLAKSFLADEKLKSHFDRVKQQKRIADWIEKRPTTER
ncbi:S-crystallin SL11 [Mizuhopecten yessoensis]|uniref:glutathione transferase n=1 Tax=Mizuhopecten yessoensis TaxID=6573 RepID=A0A210PPR3_MIZYE|nr:S-crystallin SL11 [Mizuhopecten yessoensis]